MTNQFKKKQHYIPRFYLKRFTDKDGFLHIFDTEKHYYFRATPDSFGYENNLYETKMAIPNKLGEKFLLRNDIENTFARYEGEFDAFLKKLDRICTPKQSKNALILHTDEKEILYRLIANFLLRNPVTMDELDLNNTGFMNTDEKERLDKLLCMLSLCSIDELIMFTNKKFALTEEIDGNGIKQISDNIRKLGFVFVYSPEGHFITSSFPITIGEDNAILSEDKTSIHCALSPKLSVLFGNYSAFEHMHNRMIRIENNNIVRKVNDQAAKPILNHGRTLIASSKENLMKYIKNGW